MRLRAEEISQIIKDEIKDFDTRTKAIEVGVILTVGDGVARVFGLENAQSGELVRIS